MRRVLIIACVAAAVAAALWAVHALGNSELRRQVRDLQVELAHSRIPVLRDTIRDSIPVEVQTVVEIDRTDYRRQLADRQLISDLRLRVAEVESENRQLRSVAGTVTLAGRDTDSVLLYRDEWASFRYVIPSRELSYQVDDSLAAFVTRVPRHRFLWWRWGTRGYQVHIVNFNPHASVRYSQYLKVDH